MFPSNAWEVIANPITVVSADQVVVGKQVSQQALVKSENE